jgi:hypothetical protein
MVRPPSLEETFGGLSEQFSKIVTQRFGQVSIDFRGSYTRMSEQDLDDADVNTPLKHVRGEAVPERMRSEVAVEAALASSLTESGPGRRVWQVRNNSPTGEEPSLAPMGLPDFPKHVQNRFGQREGPFLVSLANQTKNHLLRVDCGDRQSDCLADSQAVGVDYRKASTIDGLLQCRDQAAAILIGANVG